MDRQRSNIYLKQTASTKQLCPGLGALPGVRVPTNYADSTKSRAPSNPEQFRQLGQLDEPQRSRPLNPQKFRQLDQPKLPTTPGVKLMPVSWLLPLLLADVVGSLSDAPDARLLAAVRSWRKERRLDHETENPSHGGTVLRRGLWGFPWKTRPLHWTPRRCFGVSNPGCLRARNESKMGG